MSSTILAPQPLTPSLLLQRMNHDASSDTDSDSSISRVIVSDEDDDAPDSPESHPELAVMVPRRSPRDLVTDVTVHVVHTLEKAFELVRTDLVKAVTALPLASYLPMTMIQTYLVKDLSKRIAATKEVITIGVAQDVQAVFLQEEFLRDDIDSVEEQWERFQIWVEEYVVARISMVVQAVRLYITEGVPAMLENWVGRMLSEGVKWCAGGMAGVSWVASVVSQVLEACVVRGEAVLSDVRLRVRKEMLHFRKAMAARSA